MKDIVFPILEEHQAYINSGENPDEISKRLLEVCQKINLQLELITPNSKAEWEAIGLAKELFEKGDIENGYNTLKPFFPSNFPYELLAFSIVAASISFSLGAYISVKLGGEKLFPLIVRPIMYFVFIANAFRPMPINIFVPTIIILVACQLPNLIIQSTDMGWTAIAMFITVIIFVLVLLSRPIFEREQKEWLWQTLIVLLILFLGFILCSPLISLYLYGPPMPYIPR